MAEAPAWRLRDRQLPLDRPRLVGVLNVTPDSFSDGGDFVDAEAAVEWGLALTKLGADIIDVGGESTRPGSGGIDEATERNRVLPVISELAARGATVSVDTTKSSVAEEAIGAGAEIVNDISAGSDPEMWPLAAERGVGLVVMHMQGTPLTMQDSPHYDDVVAEVKEFLLERASTAEAAGVARDSIVLDPGIGFGKTLQHNLELLRCLPELVSTGYPILVGTSRKGFLGALTGLEDPRDRDTATAATTALAVAAGVALVRVHDVEASRQAAEISMAVSRVRI